MNYNKACNNCKYELAKKHFSVDESLEYNICYYCLNNIFHDIESKKNHYESKNLFRVFYLKGNEIIEHDEGDIVKEIWEIHKNKLTKDDLFFIIDNLGNDIWIIYNPLYEKYNGLTISYLIIKLIESGYFEQHDYIRLLEVECKNIFLRYNEIMHDYKVIIKKNLLSKKQSILKEIKGNQNDK